MTEKKGFFQSFLDRIKTDPKSKPQDYIEDNIGGNSLRIVSDGKLERREATYRELLTAMNLAIAETECAGYITELQERLAVVHLTISLIAQPYARAGDNKQFAKLVHGWNKMYSVSWCWCIQDLTNHKNDGLNLTAAHRLHFGLVNHIFPDAFDTLGYCYRDMDVRERAVTVIQTMMPMMGGGGGETITGSGGRTSEDRQMRQPQGGPYPRTMKNETG